MTVGGAADRIADLLADIESIPGVIERLATDAVAASVRAAVAQLGGGGPQRLLIAGLGSSRFAALQAAGALRATGLEVEVQPASGDTLPTLEHGLCIAISSSGSTREVVDVASRYRGTVPVLAITRGAGSPLAAAADAVVPLPVEPERSGVAVPSFVATIGVLELLAAELAAGVKPDFGGEAADARDALASRASWLPAALDAIDGAEEIAVLSPWSIRGTAEQAALLFRECPRRSATAFETAEWLHIGVYTALPGSVTLLFDGSPADDEVERTILGRGGRVVRVGSLGRDGAGAAGLPNAVGGLAGITGPAILAAEWWRSVAADPSDDVRG